jgi:hypothetical protein
MKISPIHIAKTFAANFNDKKYDRVKKVAIEALKVLGATLLGALAGGLTLASSGTIWIVVGAALGAGTALGSYGIGKTFVHLQKKRAFPAHSFQKKMPIDPSAYFTRKKEQTFVKTLDEVIKPLPEYAEWKKLKGNKSDRQAMRIFRKAIRQQCSQGQAYSMLAAAASKKPATDKHPFGRLDAKLLMKTQMLEIMSNDLGDKGQRLKVKMLEIPSAAWEKSLHFEKKAFPSRAAFLQDLKKPLIGTATFLKGEQRHSIFFEVTEKGGRLYDGGHKLAGFHNDFASQEQFLGCLYKHIRLGILGHKILRNQYQAVQIELFEIA